MRPPLSRFPPRFFVRPGEAIHLEERIVPAWAVERLVAALLVVTILAAGPVVAFGLADFRAERTILSLVLGLAALLLATNALWVWRRVATTEYVLTDEAVYTRRGQLVLTANSAPLDRITDLHVHTSILGRMFGFSSLLVATAGGSLHLPGLRDAYHVRGAVHDQRRAFLARLLADAGRPPAAGPAPVRPTPPECRCPRCESLVPVAGPLPFAVTCPSCGLEGVLFEEALA